MNKVELIKAVAEATNNTQKDIKVIMEAVQDVTYGALVEGDEVKLMVLLFLLYIKMHVLHVTQEQVNLLRSMQRTL